jgi:hypothetical protein
LSRWKNGGERNKKSVQKTFLSFVSISVPLFNSRQSRSVCRGNKNSQSVGSSFKLEKSNGCSTHVHDLPLAGFVTAAAERISFDCHLI